jgi:carbon-monoxide dehydrogenase medium subunit
LNASIFSKRLSCLPGTDAGAKKESPVYPAEFEYFAPQSVDEALELLVRYGDDAKILAGGQSLIPMMKLRIASPRYLIDVNRIESLTGIRRSDTHLVLGALCRHADIAVSPLVRELFPLMTDAAKQTADVQVRNRGTLGGSLAHADPAGDWPAALLALDAVITITNREGHRQRPLRAFLVDAYTTDLQVGDMLTEIAVPLPTGPCGGAYVKFEKRAGDFAVASVGVRLALNEAGVLRSIAISLGALGATPTRAQAAEEILTGQSPSADQLQAAEALVRAAAEPFEDTRGSVEYKCHLAGVLFRRAFGVALGRAKGEELETLHL